MRREHGICRRCGADVLWVTTPRGRWMPLDANPSDAGNVEVTLSKAGFKVGRVLGGAYRYKGGPRHTAHFGTCGQLKLFGEARP